MPKMESPGDNEQMLGHEECLTVDTSQEQTLSCVSDTRQDRKRRPFFGQAVVATLVYLTAFICGLTGGFSGVLLPQLRSNSSDLLTDEEMGSWIVSIYNGATSIGCLASGIIMDLAGRRGTVQVAVFSMTAGWVFISLSNSHTLMLIGRALDGFGRGHSIPAFTSEIVATTRYLLQFHLEEMADPTLRGVLSACILLSYSIGIMAVSMLGTSLNWRVVAGLGVVVSLLDLVGYSFLPESPVWFARHGRVDRARYVYRWLWGPHFHSRAEDDLEELMNRIREEEEEHERKKSETSSKLNLKQYLRVHFIKPFFIIHIFNIFQVICGTNVFIFYVVDIVSGLNKHDNIDVNFTVILTSIVRVIFLVVSCFFLVWFGRRTISVSSGLGSGIAAIAIGVASYSQETHGWILILLLLVYVAFNTYGYFVLPTTMVGEILPSKIRPFGGAYIFTLNDIGMFAATKTFPSIIRSVGTEGLFVIFGVSSILCSLFLYLFLPETKGHSLVEVEEYFLQPNILWHTRNKYSKRRVTII